jgi:hypothetical protein
LRNKIENLVEKDFKDFLCHTQQVAASVSISSDDQKTVRVAQLTYDTTTRQDQVVCPVGTAEQSRTYRDLTCHHCGLKGHTVRTFCSTTTKLHPSKKSDKKWHSMP